MQVLYYTIYLSVPLAWWVLYSSCAFIDTISHAGTVLHYLSVPLAWWVLYSACASIDTTSHAGTVLHYLSICTTGWSCTLPVHYLTCRYWDLRDFWDPPRTPDTYMTPWTPLKPQDVKPKNYRNVLHYLSISTCTRPI